MRYASLALHNASRDECRWVNDCLELQWVWRKGESVYCHCRLCQYFSHSFACATNWLVVCIDQYCHCCSDYKAFYVLGVILRLKFA